VTVGLTLALLVLPIIIVTTCEALRAAPPTIREAAYALGATRWRMIADHVLPAASRPCCGASTGLHDLYPGTRYAGKVLLEPEGIDIVSRDVDPMAVRMRVSHYTAFMYLGEVVEFGPTGDVFTTPRVPRTQDYITGRFS
jgi:hypothetical protein